MVDLTLTDSEAGELATLLDSISGDNLTENLASVKAKLVDAVKATNPAPTE